MERCASRLKNRHKNLEKKPEHKIRRPWALGNQQSLRFNDEMRSARDFVGPRCKSLKSQVPVVVSPTPHSTLMIHANHRQSDSTRRDWSARRALCRFLLHDTNDYRCCESVSQKTFQVSSFLVFTIFAISFHSFTLFTICTVCTVPLALPKFECTVESIQSVQMCSVDRWSQMAC